MSFLEITQGQGPVILGLPHTGTDLPPEVRARLNARGQAIPDTDWHIHTLYDGLLPDVTTVRMRVHRYAIDVNRDPTGASLYPGQNTTGLCPLTDFDGKPIYREGGAPDADEIERRREMWHAPYHAALQAEMERVHARHGHAILYDCHSIRGRIPHLFDGMLPDFNIGTNDGQSCAAGIADPVVGICANAPPFRSVLNGRFKGGWTTRHYGRPEQGWHAIQMELAQRTYMVEAPPWDYAPNKAQRLRPYLAKILKALSDWNPA